MNSKACLPPRIIWNIEQPCKSQIPERWGGVLGEGMMGSGGVDYQFKNGKGLQIRDVSPKQSFT